MALFAWELVRAANFPIGVNVRRSESVAALTGAHAAGASLRRVNVFSGLAIKDQGIIGGWARELLSPRRALGPKVAVLADGHVKHAFRFGELSEASRDAARNGTDALILRGKATGVAPDPKEAAKEASGLPALVGSGDTPEYVSLYSQAQGAIVGAGLKHEGIVENPVDPKRVRRLARVLLGLC